MQSQQKLSSPQNENILLPHREKGAKRNWIFAVLLIFILATAAYFRITGLFWGENQYLHPDERFLVWVGTDIQPVGNLAEYFDTANSTLNPHNVGHGFYVYGTLPMFVTRYIVQWTYGHSGFKEMTEVGRTLSTLVDILTVLLVFLIAERIYGKRIATLAAAFSAAAVLQIQQSHFFTMDTFINFFSFLAFYFAVRVMVNKRAWEFDNQQAETLEKVPVEPDTEMPNIHPDDGSTSDQESFGGGILKWAGDFFRDPLFLSSLGFGIALGMAVASKLNAAPMALMLPAAMLVGLYKTPARDRMRRGWQAFSFLILAAFVSLLVFRVCQPYAFSGPGFFGIKPNPLWMDNLRNLRAQGSGDVDFPPAMQWARRPVWFSLQNLVLWGLGLPLGLLSWAGFLWIAWRMIKIPGEWRRHALIWGWTAIYFIWQSLQTNPTMRYQLPIYPTLAIFAAWAVIRLYESWNLRKARVKKYDKRPIGWRIAALFVGGVVLVATYGYALGFSQIYARPITRIEASRWIYQNIPGPINLAIETDERTINQALPFPYGMTLTPGLPHSVNFNPKASGNLSQIYLPRVQDENASHERYTLVVSVQQVPDTSAKPPVSATLTDDLTPEESQRGKSYTLALDQTIRLNQDQTYSIKLELLGEPVSTIFEGDLKLRVRPNIDVEAFNEQTIYAPVTTIDANTPYSLDFLAEHDGFLTQINVKPSASAGDALRPKALRLTMSSPGEPSDMQYTDLTIDDDPNGEGYFINLVEPLAIFKGESHLLMLDLQPNSGAISLSGMGIANEGDWDDGLPLRLDGYDGFGGIYPLELNFNMYWDDNPDKLARFIRILDAADYVVISSSRQWGSLPRLPERFPMTTVYYRELLGCPPTEVIEFCYNVAKPGMYRGSLGYKLVQIFQSDPGVGELRINDQFAEEAFTVYDHPKVLIFEKQADYDSNKVRNILSAVNFNEIVRTPPIKAESYPMNLLLPDYRLAEQSQGGTWSEIFNTVSLINRSQPLAVIIWYLSLSVLGWLFYPWMRQALPGLSDRGYPLARSAALLVFSYCVWLAGSMRVPFSKTTISIVLAAFSFTGLLLAYRQRRELKQEVSQRWRYYLAVEVLVLAFFLAFLLVRIGNPDIWHPWKGGEKPMDFSYFNAVLQSTTFPPYDPWYAGGYLNYYYYGFVFIGVLVKFLGINPSVAYNLALPTLFSMIAMGAFSLSWNLAQGIRNRIGKGYDFSLTSPTFIPAVAGALGMAVLGNLGIVRMVFQGYQRLVAPGGIIEGAGLLTRWVWALRGFVEVLRGANLPYGIGDWYWIPSRAIPAPGDIEPITEFPFFTALYADLHAHLFALPIALLAMAFPLSMVLGRGRLRTVLGAVSGFALGGLAIGALRPTNTWDFYPYLALGIIAIGYALWSNFNANESREFSLHPLVLQTLVVIGGGALLGGAAFILRKLPSVLINLITKAFPTGVAGISPYIALGLIPVGLALWTNSGRPRSLKFTFLTEKTNVLLTRTLVTLGGMVLLGGLAFLFFRPYAQWYALGYSKVAIWRGTHTPPSAYFTHWGLFLFIIVTWMLWETRQWMAQTPLSALRKLEPFRIPIFGALLLLIFSIFGLYFVMQVKIGWIVLPLATWAGILLIRPGMPDAKRFVLFLIGTGLTLTLMVEIIVLVGDIGRMNTVFKFYLQVWTLFAISAAAALGWTLKAIYNWLPGWRRVWSIGLFILVMGAALYPLMASMAKIKDRMAPEAPHTLDGMAFMAYATYGEEWGRMDLAQDYYAIRWLQENVEGSPVIVEANQRALYRWGSRMSIYTGLPGVVGWEWHQQQQRAINPGTWVSQRIDQIDNFYQTEDLAAAEDFLRLYDVKYIIVGQQERGKYPGPGLDKFPAAEGILWEEVYNNQETIIYEVVEDIFAK